MSKFKEWIESIEHKTKDELMELIGQLSSELKKIEGAIKKTGKELIEDGEKLYEKYSPELQKAVCSTDKISDSITPENIQHMSDLISKTLDASTHIDISPKIINTFCVMILKSGLQSYCKNYKK